MADDDNPLKHGVLVLNDYQFEHFYNCMTKPAKPTKAMEEAARRILEMTHGKTETENKGA